MKFKCKWCHQDIEITQSEKSKNGMKKLEDHETECFKTRNHGFAKIINRVQEAAKIPVPDKFDMEGIIKYLHWSLGRIPNEGECMRFHMFLQTFTGKPTGFECEQFIELLKRC